MIDFGVIANRLKRQKELDADSELIRQTLNGNSRSFNQLVERYQHQIYCFILKHVPSEKAEDLAQDTFISAYESLEQFRGDSTFSTWLYGIAMNKVRNHLSRAPEHRYKYVSADFLLERQSRESSPLERVEQTLQLTYLLDRLPPDLKEVIIFVSLEGLSYKETAEAMGLPVGTVRSKVFRARQLLKEFVKESE